MEWYWWALLIVLFLTILVLALIFHRGCNILSGHESEKEIIREDEFGRRV